MVICGSVQTRSLIAYMFVEQRIFHQIISEVPTLLGSNANIYKCLGEKYSNKKDDYILFPFSEIFITFKISSVFNIVPLYNQRVLEGV